MNGKRERTRRRHQMNVASMRAVGNLGGYHEQGE
jgi:hypothetical protein